MPDPTTHGAPANAGAEALKPWPDSKIKWQDPAVQDKWIPVSQDRISSWRDVGWVMNNWARYVLEHQKEWDTHEHDNKGAVVYPPGGKHPPPDPPFGG